MLFFFFNDTATTEIYTLSLHDALPISGLPRPRVASHRLGELGGERGIVRVRQGAPVGSPVGGGEGVLEAGPRLEEVPVRDRKSTRLNSSHANISYAVFCLKKKKTILTLTSLLADQETALLASRMPSM